jgi:hypothetical protein
MKIPEELNDRLEYIYAECAEKSDAFLIQRLQDEIKLFDETITDDDAHLLVWVFIEGL